MKNSLILRQIGKFFHVYDDDAYILYYLFDYKIKNYKCGFPITALNKVINELTLKNISFIIKSSNGNEEVDFKRKNKYKEFVRKGKEKELIEQKNKNIEEMISKLSDEEIDKVYEFIESLVYEK